MPRGAPDYSNVRAYGPIQRLDDMAELAARLGSICVYERGGRVFWLEDFNQGLGAWNPITVGTGADISLSTEYPEFPPFCVLMTGGSDDERLALLATYFAPLTLSKTGIEVSLAFFSPWDTMDIKMYRYDSETRYQATVRLDYTKSEIQVLHSDNKYKKVADLPNLRQGYGVYHKLKLVADFDNNTYDRLFLNQTFHKLGDYELQQEPSGLGEHYLLHLYYVSREGWTDQVRVDGVILTHDEQ